MNKNLDGSEVTTQQLSDYAGNPETGAYHGALAHSFLIDTSRTARFAAFSRGELSLRTSTYEAPVQVFTVQPWALEQRGEK